METNFELIRENAAKLSRLIAVRGLSFLRDNQGTLMFLFGAALISFGLSELALAQEGAQIFGDATSTLACKVMPGKFGAMLSAFAGIFAIVAAATGSYRGAWMLVFVSVGSFIFKELIQILFPNSVGC